MDFLVKGTLRIFEFAEQWTLVVRIVSLVVPGQIRWNALYSKAGGRDIYLYGFLPSALTLSKSLWAEGCRRPPQISLLGIRRNGKSINNNNNGKNNHQSTRKYINRRPWRRFALLDTRSWYLTLSYDWYVVFLVKGIIAYRWSSFWNGNSNAGGSSNGSSNSSKRSLRRLFFRFLIMACLVNI